LFLYSLLTSYSCRVFNLKLYSFMYLLFNEHKNFHYERKNLRISINISSNAVCVCLSQKWIIYYNLFPYGQTSESKYFIQHISLTFMVLHKTFNYLLPSLSWFKLFHFHFKINFSIVKLSLSSLWRLILNFRYRGKVCESLSNFLKLAFSRGISNFHLYFLQT
jgi:hypothetical protein